MVDTNVWYQALRNTNGASHFILQLIYERRLQVALSVSVLLEMEDVLLRPSSLADLNLMAEDIRRFLRFMTIVGIPQKIYYRWRPNLPDEADNIFVELAVASGSHFIVTNNIRDFTQDAELRFENLKIVTSAQFVQEWRTQNE
ncbi:MAG: putative toxin-antitoxin system toxin component, PIN family [Anaerolineales bacterium]|nr:putative toxin-antitoxin system toxin component, PIN family [Anaerolineales bacterium]